MDNASVLKIKNEKGELLTVTKGCPTATKTKGKVVETIDLREKRHLNLFNLIRMAVISLEVDEKK
ncbi:MAG: hypothetical protein CV045_11035 [Cyanobacteria bacterium M5B4]|nr:MAG: hypothetical protein CV045_11035 [Cyanobacteria bacterium M5B4]